MRNTINFIEFGGAMANDWPADLTAEEKRVLLDVLRALRHAITSAEAFARFAVSGLAVLFGLQSAINMAVNLHLMPAKGMTLPFISYGGSSMISLAYAMGMLLALARERPRAELLADEERLRAGVAA